LTRPGGRPGGTGSERAAGLPLRALVLLVAALLLPAGGAAALCGDGVLDAGEECDDGNLFASDCCSEACALQQCSTPAQPLVEWEALGPFDVGGRVTSLAVDPSDPGRWLVGTPAAGVWRSEDGGASWISLVPWLDAAPVSAIAIDPADSDRYVVGTGVLQDTGTVSDALGSLHSDDAGVSWSFQANTDRKAYIADVEVWSGDPGRVLLATDRGLLLSTDGGDSFVDVKTGDSFSSVLQDPFDATRGLASGRRGFYESLDSGATWALVAEWPGVDDFEGVGVATAVLAASQQTQDVLRAAVQDLLTFVETDRIILLESVDGGASWSELPAPPGLCPTDERDRCGFSNALAIDPADDDRMLLGGDRLWLSQDAGQTWQALDPALRGVHEIVPAAGGAVVAGRFGVARLDLTWQTATLRNDGLAITRVVGLDGRGDGALLLSSADKGTVLGEGDPFGWSVVFGANEPASESRFDPFDADVLYAGLRRGDFSRSDDGGDTWSTITTGLSPTQTAADVAPLAVNPLVEGELFTGRLQLFRSGDRGDQWSEYRPPGAPEVGVIVTSPVDPDRLFFALQEGGTLFKADGIFTDPFLLDPALDARVTSIFPDGSENRIYVGITNTNTTAGSLWRTEDFGANWEDRSFGKLPAVNDVVRDAFGALYVATPEGVYRSASEGIVWSPFSQALPTGNVTRLILDAGHVVAGTRGRGVFQWPIRPLVTVDTIPPGNRLLVDGILHQGPVFADWAPGSEHTIEPYLLQTEDTRQEFVSWSNGGSQSQVFVGTGLNEWPTAVLKVLHRLRMQVSPPEGGSIRVNPASEEGDDFYPVQSFVQLVAVPAADHRASGWTGELSSVDRLLGGVRMDGPRSVTANFEPLRVRFHTEPEGLDIDVDGATITTPQVFQWEAGSSHPLEPPELVDLVPGDGLELAFDRWSDFLPRVHDFEMRSETFTADVTAFYVPVVRDTVTPAGGVQRITTLGQQSARRELALELGPAAGDTLPPTVQVLRSTGGGTVINELVFPRGLPTTRVNGWVEGRSLDENGGLTGDRRLRRHRLVVFNPGPGTASLDVVLQAGDGTATAGGPDLVAVPAGEQRVLMLDEVLGLPLSYSGAVSVQSDQPVVVKLLGVTENLRFFDFTDPILFHAFDESDDGMPAAPDTQVVLATPASEHVLVLINTEPVASDGTLRILDRDGAVLEAEVDGSPATDVPFALAGGAHTVLRLRFPSGVPGTGTVPHARLALDLTGGPAPRLRLVSEQELETTRYGISTLPHALPPSRQAEAFRVPVDLDRRDTGLVLTNPGTAAATVDLTLVDGQGGTVSTHTVPLPADAQRAVLVSELDPAPPAGFFGQLLAAAPAPVEAVGFTRMVNGRGEEVLAGFPVLGPTGDAPDTPHHYAYAKDGDTWSSEWWLLSDLAAPVTASLSLVDDQGRPRNLPMEAPATP